MKRSGSRRPTGPGRLAPVMVAAAVLCLATLPLSAQRLEDYDYENLRLRGVGGEIFLVAPNDLEAAIGFGGRIDLGFLGPNVRVMPRVAYWSSDLTEEELSRLSTRIESLVEEQNPGVGDVEVSLGDVDRSAFIAGSDLHWLPLITEPVRPYVGFGAELYILNGSGEDIEDTFVEDALDLITAGVSGVAGVEVDVGSGLTVYGDLRGTLVADVGGVAVTAGVGYLVP